jgi:uncharacterized protein (DUF486 family)
MYAEMFRSAVDSRSALSVPIRPRHKPCAHGPELAMSVFVQTIGLLILSNVFMTFAWYAHLKDMRHLPWFSAAAISWGIAFFEYMIQVPANRLGDAGGLQLPQLKILQEVVTLTVFIPFALYYMKRPLTWDFLWAALCMCGAVFFVFRSEFASRAP